MDKREQAAESVFGEALDLPREERAAFLERSCEGDPELRRMIEDLLDENDRLSGFLSAPALGNTKAKAVAGTAVQAGTRLVDRYLIVEQLGAGGMGVVYRARDEKLEREVAIKMLQPGVLTGEDARGRFRREARALAKLNHTHIAAVYDVIEQDGADFIVMELVAGESLAAKLRGGALGAREATSIALQVAEALEDAHEQGVIHRDLKPANVMITPKGQAKVLDFGLAKLMGPADATQSVLETGGVMGTPLYMSPEQALGKKVDARTDLWSLGVMYYESLTGRPPFMGGSSLGVLQAITDAEFRPLREVRPEAPADAEKIVAHALEKDPEKRYATAAAMALDLSALSMRLSGAIPMPEAKRSAQMLRMVVAGLAVVLIAGSLGGWWLYRRTAERHWARDEAIPKIQSLMEARLAVQAFSVLERAERDLPGDEQIQKQANETTERVTITSEPAGAEVELQDYLTPRGPVLRLGTTPLTKVRIPKGYFRWTLTKAGTGTMVVAPETAGTMHFDLARAQSAPAGMVYAAGGGWATFNAFIGWIGPYEFPAYYIDKYEVTNRAYQEFVDQHGYEKPEYWSGAFRKDGQTLRWSEAMQLFRDTTGRAGPSTWAGGHYPEGTADDPVAGVSWYEAAAYAKWAGKALPVLGQWYAAADFDVSQYTIQLSNLRSSGLAAGGKYPALGPYGTYDLAGNVREWIANPADKDLHFILGGSWRTPIYLYSSPEALSPFDRSDTNGFRCVRNLGALPEASVAPIHQITRDFAAYKPVNDEVFAAYKLLYAYPHTPLNAHLEGVVKETADWREEKVTFDAAYNGERMAAYLFLPKRVRPPYQTVLFFPSARVMFLPPDSSELGDVNYFDYVIQSGRAVMYPVYEDTYERRVARKLPADPDEISEPIDWYKDAARSLDYLATRPDVDTSRIGYLGVSMGSANGAIYAALMGDRLRTAVFLDGGYFLDKLPPGIDQADFLPRLKIPVLMVNGRYDYTFPLETSQEPFFRMLGMPAADKRHVVLDTPHDVSEQRPQMVKAVLDWLDKYLGRVE